MERSYRFHFAVKSLAAFFQIAVFFFIGRLMGAPEYFPFVFVGLIFSRFVQFWLNIFAENIRQEQYWGTAEPVFLSPSSPLAVTLSSSAGKFLLLLLELAVYGVLGIVVFGIEINLRWLFLLPLLAATAFTFAGFGLLSGSFIMYFKRGDPVNWLLSVTFDLLSGVYFPVAILPRWLRSFADLLPTTSALNIWRSILLSSSAPRTVDIMLQIAWATVLWVVGVVCFRKAFELIRSKGELGSY